jgi:protein-disulfide isomerase-like protein with CxxC motif
MKERELEQLIIDYYNNKKAQDEYKKICDEENKQIKQEMGIATKEFDGYKATVYETTKVKIDEQRLLAILKANGYSTAIKTKEYVDMDELESLIYNSKIDAAVLKLIGQCKNEDKIQTLRVTRK